MRFIRKMYFAKNLSLLQIVRFAILKKKMNAHKALQLMPLIWPNRILNWQCSRAWISLSASGTRIVFASYWNIIASRWNATATICVCWLPSLHPPLYTSGLNALCINDEIELAHRATSPNTWNERIQSCDYTYKLVFVHHRYLAYLAQNLLIKSHVKKNFF